MAFEKGNKLAAKSGLFDQALRRAISQDDGKRLRACAEKLLDLAAEGENWAIRELADRLDGKAVQVANVTISDERAEELSDSELFRIAAGSSDRTAEAPSSTQESSKLH